MLRFRIVHSIPFVLLLIVPGVFADDIRCAGLFSPSISEARLRSRLGEANVKRAEIDVGEGETEPGTVVFPKDPSRHVEILWADPIKRQRPASISFGDRSTVRVGNSSPGHPYCGQFAVHQPDDDDGGTDGSHRGDQ
jgi:hypothetical protein